MKVNTTLTEKQIQELKDIDIHPNHEIGIISLIKMIDPKYEEKRISPKDYVLSERVVQEILNAWLSKIPQIHRAYFLMDFISKGPSTTSDI